MDKATMVEIAKTDPVYAAALGAGDVDSMDRDRICIEIGRATMAILSLQRHGWALVRDQPLVECPRCGGNGMQFGGVCDECGGLREVPAT